MDAMTMDEVTLNNNAHTKAKRSRVQFSCTACRYRKLKCDRNYPCDRCTRRGDAASCTYVGHGPRGRTNHAASSSPSHIQNRIQHLENLILSFAQQKKQEDEGPNSGTSSSATTAVNSNEALEPSPPTSDATDQNTALDFDPGKLRNDEQAGTTYIDASHWQAILDDLQEVKKYVQINGREHEDLNKNGFLEDGSTDETIETEYGTNRPTLLFYGSRVPTKQELLADMPDRATVDRLIAKFLNSDDPSLVLFHFPTFHREYTKFWNDPSRVSLPWLALLYGSMTMAVGMFQRSMEQLPSSLGDAADELSRFERNCCYCLINSNYTTVGKYKVEALIIYASIEYTKKGNSAMSVSVILGITVKLAMRMGYHRDASHYDNLSAFEGEMRRRSWTILCQLDTLTSFQVGIPKQTQGWQSDTEVPRNIDDEDFDENSIELPPSKPDSVRTSATYLRSKRRIMAAFGQICDLAYSPQAVTYEKVLELDQGLEGAFESMESSLRMRPMNQSFADGPSLIMKRYTLDMLYQKARIVLHRRYLVEARSDPRVSYSRSVCVNAAKETLRHQYDLYQESQPGGRMEKNNWFFQSLQINDFVLAAMVICLELSKNQQDDSESSPDSLEERKNLIEILRKSRNIWKDSLKYSIESRKAYCAVTIMLKKAEMDDRARNISSQNPLQQNDQPIHTENMPANFLQDTSQITGGSPGDIAPGESASSRRFQTAQGQDTYMDGILPPNMSVDILTPPMSNSSGQTVEGHNIAATNSTGAGSDTADIMNVNQFSQLQQVPVSSHEIFQQQYPEFQSSIPGLGVIETMLDTPQNLDWRAWDDNMESNDPSLWDEYWNPGGGIISGSNTMQIHNNNNNNIGNNQVNLQQQPPHNTITNNNNSNGNNVTSPSRSGMMLDLYFAPGFKG